MKRFLAFLLLAVFVVVMGLMFTSCSTRKVAREQTKIETKEKDTVSETSKTTVVTEIKKQIEEKITEKQTKKEISAEVKDGETLQVDEFDKDGNHKGSTVFKGSGKATVKEEEKNKASAKTIEEKAKQDSGSEKNKNASSEKNDKRETESEEVERKSYTDLYIIIAGTVVAFFLLWRLKQREV